MQPLPTSLPADVQARLKQASDQTAQGPVFTCSVWPQGPGSWNAFVEEWAPKVYAFILEALGPYGTAPLPHIIPLGEGHHASGATAAFANDGQVYLSPVVKDMPGMTLEKLCHEFLHGSLSALPQGDAFYEEGFVDYSTWCLAHAPVWGPHREAMIQAAAYNIAQRHQRAKQGVSDWDNKRWAGGCYAMMFKGPWIIAHLKATKESGALQWF